MTTFLTLKCPLPTDGNLDFVHSETLFSPSNCFIADIDDICTGYYCLIGFSSKHAAEVACSCLIGLSRWNVTMRPVQPLRLSHS